MKTASDYRAEATQHEQNALDSFERCDTDGFLSQWASGLNAEKARVNARLAENGGKAEFPALFTLRGELVAAKLIPTQYGTAWGVLATDDPESEIVKWVGAFPARKSTMEKKGYREGRVLAPAYTKISGSSTASCFVEVKRADGGFSLDVEIVDNGR